MSVEGGDNATDLVAAADRQALARPQQVDGVHALCESLKGRDRAAKQDRVRRQP